MCASKYLAISVLLARISKLILDWNFSVICGMSLEVAKMFTPQLAWMPNISDRNTVRHPWDASSSASIIIKTLEYRDTTD